MNALKRATDPSTVECPTCDALAQEPCKRWWSNEFHWRRHMKAYLARMES